MSAEKKTRNKAIVKKYKPHKFGYKKLGKLFGISWHTVRDIVEREKKGGDLSTSRFAN